ncbi:MAG: hypothetical protein V2B19_22420 [Pseudomonadota bacterium]
MSSDDFDQKAVDPLPAQFMYRFLESQGAAIEKTDTGYHAMLPEALSSALNVSEYIHVQAASGQDRIESRADDAREYAVHYGAPLLDQAIAMACGKAPLLTYRLHIDYLKRQGFDRLIEEQFRFPNAVGKVESHAVVQTEYLMVTCWYSARSDEQKEGLVTLAFNLETGAGVPGVEALLPLMNREVDHDAIAAANKDERIKTVLPRMAPAFTRIIHNDTAAFQESMNRRFRRDVESLNAYYGSLRQEMENSLRRPGLSSQLIAEREEKIRLIPDELLQKRDDLYKKYSVKIKVHPCAMIRIKVQAVKVRHAISVGKAGKTISLMYNPITKALDPMVCEGCGRTTFVCSFCGRFHLLCPACCKRCPVCPSRPA